MSVKIRPYRKAGWEVDIQFRLPDGSRHRRDRCLGVGRHRPRPAADQHSPLGLARATDDPEERAGTVRGDDGAYGDGSSEAPSPPQFTRLL